MNILLLMVDTLRADHLGCYGYGRDTSPHLDRLAGEGVLFEAAFANGVPTLPSFTTLYTGQHPLTHQIVSHGGEAILHPDRPFFVRELQRAGYHTAAVDNLRSVRPWCGWGYEEYIDWSTQVSGRMHLNGEQVNEIALPWLRRWQGEQPFFLMVHYWDPHTVYNPPPRLRQRYYDGDPTAEQHDSLAELRNSPLGELWADQWLTPLSNKLFGGRPIRDAEYVVALYDACVRYVDEAIGAVLATLQETGLADNTLVMVLADHGEMLYRHGIFFDHHGLYDGNIHLPCLVRWPGRAPAGRRVGGLVRMMDMAPTLLEAAGAPVPAAMEGASFLPALRGEPWRGAERLIAEECTWQAKWCLRRDGWKLIMARAPDLYGRPQYELYDLAADPPELENRAAAEPRRVKQLAAELEGWIADRLVALGRREDPLVEQGTSMGRKYLDKVEAYKRSWRGRLTLRVKQLLYPVVGRWRERLKWRRRYAELEERKGPGAG